MRTWDLQLASGRALNSYKGFFASPKFEKVCLWLPQAENRTGEIHVVG
jgi:hypothetical protein